MIELVFELYRVKILRHNNGLEELGRPSITLCVYLGQLVMTIITCNWLHSKGIFVSDPRQRLNHNQAYQGCDCETIRDCWQQ